jgi:trk system potassium uptake protein TrkH
MNTSVIRYLLGYILKLEGFLLLLPCIVAGIYYEKSGIYFLIVALISIAIGFIFSAKKPRDFTFYLKEGCATTALGWVVLSIFGCLPFYISGEIPSFTDALFETISGFTTTGASILPEVESLSYCMNFWRCFTHWIGGMGVLVFILAILPLGGSSEVYLMSAESPGPNVNKLVPKMRTTARILYVIYIVLTFINFLFLLLGKMPVFDAVCTALGTAGTGGFGIRNDSIAGYSPYIQNVCTVFMFLFGINFSCYYLLLVRHVKEVLKDQELRLYIIIFVVSILLITFNVRGLYGSWEETIRHAAFQVSSIMTTTGFASTDFDLWPGFSKALLLCLMFVGACAGSTAGGLKMGRLLLILKNLRRNIRRILSPQRVEVVRMNGNRIGEEVLNNTNTYLAAYGVILVGSFLLISIDGLSMTTNVSAVAACFNNIGPGFDVVGPTCNFSVYSWFSKLVLIFDMLAGRLEIFPMLVLFSRSTWSHK